MVNIIAVFRNPVDRLWSRYSLTCGLISGMRAPWSMIHGNVVRDINKLNNCLDKGKFQNYDRVFPGRNGPLFLTEMKQPPK